MVRELFFCVCGAVLITACVPLPHPETSPSSHPKASATFPKRIAVLPVSNQAGDTDGAIILRALVIHKLEKDLNYMVQRPEETDQIIHDRTLTGPDVPIQVAIARLDPGVLAAWLDVDGILQSQLMAFNKAKVSIYQRSQVKAHFGLKDRDGKSLWEVTKDSDNGGLLMGGGGTASLDSALATSGLDPDIISRIHQSPLGEATLDMVDDAFSTFPEP